jgi:hypothetical protein
LKEHPVPVSPIPAYPDFHKGSDIGH